MRRCFFMLAIAIYDHFKSELHKTKSFTALESEKLCKKKTSSERKSQIVGILRWTPMRVPSFELCFVVSFGEGNEKKIQQSFFFEAHKASQRLRKSNTSRRLFHGRQPKITFNHSRFASSRNCLWNFPWNFSLLLASFFADAPVTNLKTRKRLRKLTLR